MKLTKPFAESSEQNKQVILEVIKPLFEQHLSVLEIASGTGQHAVYFAQSLPHLQWQPSDLNECLPGLECWVNESGLNNLKPPIELNVSENNWPKQTYDAVFTANSLHIMNHQQVEDFFSEVHQHLNHNGLLVIYGPFNYDGKFTSDSNARFDEWLKQRNPHSGIKAFEWCYALAEKAGLILQNDYTMPHNNRILCWKKP